MPIPTIQYQSIGTPEDFNRTVISNGVCARAHGVSTWDWLRVVFRCSIGPDPGVGTNIPGFPHFFFGFCSGQAKLPLELVPPDNFAGWWTNMSVAFRVAAGATYGYDFDPCNAVTMVGATTTEYGEGPGGLGLMGHETLHRTAMMFDIKRDGGGLFTLHPALFRVSLSLGQTDADEATFLAQAIEQTPAMVDHQASGFDRQVSIDEPGDGVLDSVCFGWNVTNPRIVISDVGIVQLA